MLPAPESTRLVTIIAHVDHGKTTLADNLVESNGIISERLAGTLRYLDSDAEEQRRGITMKASAIGLRHVYNPPKMASSGGSSSPQDMVIHLIDSPGHVDFASEVTSSLLLCDSAILVVDAVEGICARTHSLLREAYMHQLVPVLVINKIDRLCMDLGLDTSEAYVRIRELIESINAVCASMLNSDVNDDTEAVDGDTSTNDNNSCLEEKKASLWSFDPIKGNVVFASGLHGWGFTIPTLARSLFKSKTIPMKPPLLRQYLFGDFKYNTENGKVLKWKQSGNNSSGEPMFAQYALAPLWEIYEGVSQAAASVGLRSETFAHNSVQNGNNSKKTENAKIQATTAGMERVLAAIQIGSTSPAVISSQPNNDRPTPKTTEDMQQLISRLGASSESSIFSAVLRRYRPLSVSVLDAVCETGPSPAKATLELRPKVLTLQVPPHQNDGFDMIQQAVHQCNPDNATVVAHVCKFASISRSAVTDPDLSTVSTDDQSSNIIMGIARVLSGTLRTGDEYYMFGPRYKGSSDDAPKQKIRCYLLMGSSFVRVKSVPAGHICAIFDLENLQLKTVTLSDKRECMPLRGFDFGLQPLVKVNVEPVNAADTEALERGLLKLSLADSSVEVTATAKGERILACLGEIHLERSILDLATVYCDGNIKIRTSDPITSFRETTTYFPNEEDFDSFRKSKIPPLRQTTIPPYCDEEGLEHANKGRCRAVVSGRGSAITIRVVPLPRSVYLCLKSKKLMEGCEEDIMMLGRALKCSNDESVLTPQSALTALLDSLDDIDNNGNGLLEAPILHNGRSVKAVCSTNGEIYIPRKDANNDGEDESYNVDGIEEYSTVQRCLRMGLDKVPCNTDTDEAPTDADAIALDKWKQDMRGSALAGFQLAMRAGPLCEEPVQGVAVILESVEIAMREDSMKQYIPAKELSGGMVVAALRSGIRCALLSRPARIVEGHLKLTLHSSLAGLGPLHAVLSKRRGRVVTDSMVDGTDLIQVTATIPQAESFGLAPELLKKSSGEVTAPELVFSHWEVLEEDPFWIPTTEDEREDHGDLTTASDSVALKYIRLVRSRKGLLVDSSKIVVAAEKQRTLSRKK
ncbi:hypothetical protein ACHAXM_005480 [Skeletonema potamos]